MEDSMVGAWANDVDTARSALDARLRADLGQQLTVMILRVAASPPATGEARDDMFAAFRAEITAYREVRLLTAHITPTSVFMSTFTSLCAPAQATVPTTSQTLETALDTTLRDALRMDADAVLIWSAGDVASTGGVEGVGGDIERVWLRTIPAIAERLNVFEVATLALIGPGVTREQARALSYEDGFALTEPLADAVRAALARLTDEALARAEYRHKGSSPPCYL